MTSDLRAAPGIAALRAALGAVVIGVLVYAYALGIPLQGPSVFDYFGYFTNLTSLLTSVLLVATGVRGLRGHGVPPWLISARAAAVASMIVVGLVYNLIVPGTGSAPAWVSVILHTVFPLVLVLDWLLIGDRTPQPWRRLWIVLPYPLLWLAVVLVRGVTDGWVPYGFLLPERGGTALAVTVAGLSAALLASAAVVWALSRVRSPLVRSARQPAVQP